MVDPNGVNRLFAYDPRQRLVNTKVVTAAGLEETQYAYDAVGNLLTVTLPGGSNLSYTYDPAYRVTDVTDLFGDNIHYTLNALGGRQQNSVSNPSPTVVRTGSAAFDALNRTLQVTGGAAGQTTAYTYDANSNQLTITDPLQHTAHQAFDALNRMVTYTDAAAGVAAFSYDAHDRTTAITDPIGNTTAYVYDGFGDLIQKVSPVTGSTVYRYDLEGNLTQSTDADGARDEPYLRRAGPRPDRHLSRR